MNDNLRMLQLVQLEILEVIDKICADNGISYSLYAGTLLGAVRHKGFIPWDDDLDVCMSREDYEAFISIWNDVKPKGYIIQNKENTPNFTQSFSKIRKEHTTFLQYDFEREAYHTGIFVDIFPLDRIPDNKIGRIIFRWNCLKYQLFTREFVPPKSNIFVKAISKLILLTVPVSKRKYVRDRICEKITRYKDNKSFGIVAIETASTQKQIYPADMLDKFVRIKFENKYYMCFENWKQNLGIKYGDYMKLPPEEERIWRHHPIILNFEYDYEELKRLDFREE